MNFKLIKKDIGNQNVVEERTFKSISQIAKELNTTYCSCYNNYLLNIGESTKQPKKRSQVLFNKQYSIVNT